MNQYLVRIELRDGTKFSDTLYAFDWRHAEAIARGKYSAARSIYAQRLP